MEITLEFKKAVVEALLAQRENYGSSDKDFANKWKMNNAVWSRLKNGETEGLLKEFQWLDLGRRLDVNTKDTAWKFAETEGYKAIRDDVTFCQKHHKSMFFVDENEIGKTVALEHLSKSLKNCFYVDCSQAKSKQLFVKALAQAIGVDTNGKYSDIKANIKYYLRMLINPIVLLDEFGDLEYTAFMEVKEFWNATNGTCAWYAVGADGLRDKMERGIGRKKVGFSEMFSRFSSKYMSIVPKDKSDKQAFYRKLITDVLAVNMPDKSNIQTIVKKCLTDDGTGKIGGLRRAETLLILSKEKAA